MSDSASQLPAGSAPDDAKRRAVKVHEQIQLGNVFATFIPRRMRTVEVHVGPVAGSPGRKEWVVVHELMCEQDMTNGIGALQGGAAAYLVDVCSSTALAASGRTAHVSQAINMVYHAPAPLGCRLRIVSRTMTLGSRVLTARTDIWDATADRLCASGTHVKMRPSPAPTATTKL